MTGEGPFIGIRTGFAPDPLPDRAFRTFEKWETGGRLGFLGLPADDALHRSSTDLADEVRRISDHLIVCGIGGSSLGLRALLGAFPPRPEAGVSVTVADSPDSEFLSALAARLDPEKTAVAVITKSGGTAETLAAFLSLYGRISKALDSRRRIIAVTDPERGDLRKLAAERGWRSLEVPASVGGRYSVLSPVGVFPAAFAGIDTAALLRGAAAALSDYRDRGPESLAAMIAAAFHHSFEDRPVHAFFPYSDRLFQVAFWFSQLWAESLGKAEDLSGAKRITGQTPLACRGPADQHSLVQLFMEGPADKAVTIVTTPEIGDAPTLPGGFEAYDSFAYLEGLTPDRLRLAEAEATGTALSERGIPVTWLHMRKLDEESAGSLIMCLEIATVLCGLALSVNPLDQPGVERGKMLTYRALGRPGYRD